MPMHDWTRVKAGTFHNFHVLWMSTLTNRLNAGLLPSGYFAMAEQIIGKPETDVVTLQTGSRPPGSAAGNGGVAVSPFRPRTRFVMRLAPDPERYARKANRIAIHHELGEVVAVIEIVSPGNKDRQRPLRTFVEKALDLFQQQVNLLIIDPFPPGSHDPQGLPGAICDEFSDQKFELPPDKPLTLASYQVEPVLTSYVEPIAVGDPLPEMPLFLYGDTGINVPLEETYQTTWNVLPAELRQLLEPPARR
jgi:hypothetical protein